MISQAAAIVAAFIGSLVIVMQDDAPSIRSFLLSQVLEFAKQARQCAGVQRIALVGSLTTNKRNPKDADLLVTVSDTADLTPLAAAGRRLKGRAQSRSRGADIFLADPSGQYIGRICDWRECRFGARLRCDALHCGKRTYLHDDLQQVKLELDLMKEPPVELWPTVIRRTGIPADVEDILLRPLEQSLGVGDRHTSAE
jgi:hypothetical protein